MISVYVLTDIKFFMLDHYKTVSFEFLICFVGACLATELFVCVVEIWCCTVFTFHVMPFPVSRTGSRLQVLAVDLVAVVVAEADHNLAVVEVVRSSFAVAAEAVAAEEH